jgi:hypothetical protein
MSVLKQMLSELSETYIVEHITSKHANARMKYSRDSIQVANDTEFDDVIADYYNHIFSTCFSSGATLSRADAAGRAKEIIFQEYRRRGKDKIHAYMDGKTGRNDGMLHMFEIISNALSDEAVRHHFRDVIDRYVRPSSYEEQLSLIKEIFSFLGLTKNEADIDHPEKYVKDYEELVRILVANRNTIDAKLRRF